jgi:hypothetical protein
MASLFKRATGLTRHLKQAKSAGGPPPAPGDSSRPAPGAPDDEEGLPLQNPRRFQGRVMRVSSPLAGGKKVRLG